MSPCPSQEQPALQKGGVPPGPLPGAQGWRSLQSRRGVPRVSLVCLSASLSVILAHQGPKATTLLGDFFFFEVFLSSFEHLKNSS